MRGVAMSKLLVLVLLAWADESGVGLRKGGMGLTIRAYAVPVASAMTTAPATVALRLHVPGCELGECDMSVG